MEKLRNCGLWEREKKTKLCPLEEERKTKGARTVSLPRECIFNLFIKLKLKCRKKVFPFLLLTRRSILGQGDRRQSVSITVFLYKLFNCPFPILDVIHIICCFSEKGGEKKFSSPQSQRVSNWYLFFELSWKTHSSSSILKFHIPNATSP